MTAGTLSCRIFRKTIDGMNRLYYDVDRKSTRGFVTCGAFIPLRKREVRDS